MNIYCFFVFFFICLFFFQQGMLSFQFLLLQGQCCIILECKIILWVFWKTNIYLARLASINLFHVFSQAFFLCSAQSLFGPAQDFCLSGAQQILSYFEYQYEIFLFMWHVSCLQKFCPIESQFIRGTIKVIIIKCYKHYQLVCIQFCCKIFIVQEQIIVKLNSLKTLSCLICTFGLKRFDHLEEF
eukprot:TRINITY_DN14260_c0_g1_i2.p3 TRINITY_DN14260_c0_g1~~TRINITY_DN14260_c0_g1_i2.p3  ORF type:complete len:185 (+),score=-12.43 TRINITY_DN14260_c0_g1_i2:215-769(+)